MKTRTQLALFAAALAHAACSPKPTPEASAPPTAAAEPASPPAAAPDTTSPPGPRCAENFAAFDANADQRVTRQEFLERPHAQPDPERIFQARDSDGDGSLTSDEFCSGWRGPTAAGPGRGPASGGAGMGPGKCAGPGTGPCSEPGMGMAPGAGPGMGMGRGNGPGMGMGHGGPHCEAHFTRFDSNADGNVSEAEFTALPHPHGDAHTLFVARDQNHDGLLTKEEFCAPWSPPSPPKPAPAP